MTETGGTSTPVDMEGKGLRVPEPDRTVTRTKAMLGDGAVIVGVGSNFHRLRRRPPAADRP
ncbi:hypothetical protein Msi02_84520 [Microbispora siamensis]|uniref:Uncharacterized protein n=1 Tax=Microbispora siamensis TaxID=564413 RepID=A0ABQ4H1U2_9ACTN|nr:hypothetical protein Msi02_84520 [Microbispora siamensis]